MLLQNIPQFQKTLLAWYQKNARPLPWRETKNPYRIWVSEIMLQQTQVQTVIPYYKRWIERFPNVARLAQADLQEVLKFWAGLGYYRRARMLHQGAQMLCAPLLSSPHSNGGRKKVGGIAFPETIEDLIKIPGIGRYTAGAIASIAFGKKVPVLDGNVIRILTRLLAIRENIQSPKTIRKLWAIAENILPNASIGDFNQALMELGAAVCMPQKPECGRCPAAQFCKGQKNPERFPFKKQKEIYTALQTAALILKKNGKYLIQKQPLGQRWGGLWMFPHWPDKKSMLQSMRIKKKNLRPLTQIKHGFTKYRITLNVYQLCDQRQTPPHPSPWVVPLSPLKGERGSRRRRASPKAGVRGKNTLVTARWVAASHLSSLPFPVPHQKIILEIAKNGP